MKHGPSLLLPAKSQSFFTAAPVPAAQALRQSLLLFIRHPVGSSLLSNNQFLRLSELKHEKLKMSQQQKISPKKQQGKFARLVQPALLTAATELQAQYQSFKNTLQQISQKIGDIEQEAEEHKSVCLLPACPLSPT